MDDSLHVDTTDKIVLNGVDLLNRDELSAGQNRELQRFIDENAHLLQFIDREKEEKVSPVQRHRSQYSELRNRVGGGGDPNSGYIKLDETFKKSTPDSSLYRKIGENTPQESPRLPNLEGLGWQEGSGIPSGFGGSRPGGLDTSYTKAMDNGFGKGGGYGNDGGSGRGMDSGYGTRDRGSGYGGSNYGTNPYGTMEGRGRPSSLYSIPDDSSCGRTSAMSGRNPMSEGSLKRKGVSWCDDALRARSHSPAGFAQQQTRAPNMSQYGSTGNLSLRDRTDSPSYSTLGKHRDDYNRFETKRHQEFKDLERLRREEEDRSRFSGYGDRPGSGVELASHHWNGGEIIMSPSQLPKSLKPRRIYYSPIGDGTVAADGVEKKRGPVDLSPRVTITQMSHVDRGTPGQNGVNVYEKTWSNTMPSGAGSDGGFGSDYGGGSGRNSRATGALSPSGGDPYGKGGYGSGGPGSGLGGPGSGLGGPGSGHGGPGSGLGGPGSGGDPNRGGHGGPGGQSPYGAGGPGGYGAGGDPYDGHGGPGAGGRGGPGAGGDPYGTLDSRGGNPYGSNGNLGPDPSGRMSSASSMFSDPYRVVDTKTGYLITNPRELIHQYATTTPIAVMDVGDNTPVTTKTSYKKTYSSTTEEREFAPYAPYRATNGSVSGGQAQKPINFVRQLRDETMTHSQRDANTHLDPLNQKDPQAQQKIQEIRQKTTVRGGHDEIDDLTSQLMQGLTAGQPVPSRF